MHMADALISPAVGGTLWAASAGAITCCSAKIKKEMDTSKVPLMGVMGAFIFAAQMINFTIPATGSSGHLGGGMILAVLLGPYAAFMTIASVLVVQALFFADGGLLALGCNIFNLGVFPAFIAYPFIYKPMTRNNPTQGRILAASILSAGVGLQLGAFAVVLETVASGISSLPFSTFVAIMQPIHLAIGIVEGAITAAVISFIYSARPALVLSSPVNRTASGLGMKPVALSFLAAAILTGGILSWYASDKPDGLEWSIAKVTGRESLETEKAGLHGTLAALQKKLSFLPGYSFKKSDDAALKGAAVPPQTASSGSSGTAPGEPTREGSRLGTSLSGILGGLLALALACGIGFVLKPRSAA